MEDIVKPQGQSGVPNQPAGVACSWFNDGVNVENLKDKNLV